MAVARSGATEQRTSFAPTKGAKAVASGTESLTCTVSMSVPWNSACAEGTNAACAAAIWIREAPD
jgi:hypothetical protein